MSNIKPLKTTRDEWSENVVDRLQEALVHAKENPQESVVIVMVGRDDHNRFLVECRKPDQAFGRD